MISHLMACYGSIYIHHRKRDPRAFNAQVGRHSQEEQRHGLLVIMMESDLFKMLNSLFLRFNQFQDL